MLTTTFRKICSAYAEVVPGEESSVAPVSQCIETGPGGHSPVDAPPLTPSEEDHQRDANDKTNSLPI
jgi:hypothetical protein